MIMGTLVDLFPRIIFLQSNHLARSAFEVVSKNLGISGYAVARQLNEKPDVVQQALASLVDNQLISGSAELRDNFTLTGPGFSVKQVLSQNPELLKE
jgi:hypothetical protein